MEVCVYKLKKANNMTQEEKISILEELLELENGSLSAETELSSVEEYDSMSKLSLIVMMDDEFNKKLTGEQLLAFKTVQDILDFMD
jgi:acyl carrier protein